MKLYFHGQFVQSTLGQHFSIYWIMVPPSINKPKTNIKTKFRFIGLFHLKI